MKYDVQNRSDFLTGSYLVVKIPESELDQCALHTILADSPDFIVPFHYKSTDNHVEFVYKIGTLCKLSYFSGELSPGEYSELWKSLLEPLLECADWFMNPCSLILSADCLYYDKTKKAVRYVYVPTAYGCSGYDSFYEMAAEISKIMTVSDAALENKVLRAIIKDFNPIEFLQMLRDHVIDYTSYPEETPVIEYHNEAGSVPELNTSLKTDNNAADEIIIDFDTITAFDRNPKERGSGVYRIFSRRSKRKKAVLPGLPVSSSQKKLPDMSMIQNVSENLLFPEEHNKNNMAEIIDITQCTPLIPDGPGLRYIGYAPLPPSIQIIISEGEMFTIGRFDANIGKKQSSFEFDKKTRAVSRRHAVIERDTDGYKIIDLSSSAGTFVNNQKLLPNTPHGLETGCRVSFGNSGADYVWEVS